MVSLSFAKAFLTLALLAAGLSQRPDVQSAPRVEPLESMEMRGTVGPYRIGLNYTVQQHTRLVAAHYFYVSQLKDIPLHGTVQGESVDFDGADGSRFHLHFVGNGSNGKRTLTFYNSVGLSGSWTLGDRSLPVNLEMEHGTPNPGDRLYAQVTEQPDAAYEALVAKARDAILSGNQDEAAKYVDFPLRVNGLHRSLTIQNAAELKANWARVFTPKFLAKLKMDVPHEMFVHNGHAMLGAGELWFSDKGLVALNPVLGDEDLIQSE